MQRPIIFLALAAAALVLGTSSKAQAWGCCHTGYTHVGYGGVQHYGHTSVSGPYGSYSGGHASAYGYGGGAYRASYGTSSHYGGYGGEAYGGYHYGGAYGGGYAAGGYHYGGYSGYSAGAYRAY